MRIGIGSTRAGAIAAAACATGVIALSASGAAQTSAPDRLSGTWSLDIHLSDGSEEIARALQMDTGTFPFEVARGGQTAGGAEGRNGDERPPFGEPRPGQRARPLNGRLSAEERKTLAALTRPIEFPPPTLTITGSDSSVVIRAGSREADTLRTDGTEEKLSLESGTVTRTAKWQGPLLRVAHEVGGAGSLTTTYSVVPTGQLLIRVNFERTPGRPGPFDVKLVYNRDSGSGNRNPADSRF